MTLTRTPCELDKMSLFQDLKLKRRKIDSRCSSDGMLRLLIVLFVLVLFKEVDPRRSIFVNGRGCNTFHEVL